MKADYQRPSGLLQLLKILEFKWDEVTMDFVSRLPRSSERYDSISVIVDRMTKSTYFLPMSITDPIRKLAKLYLKEIMRLCGVSVSIMLDQDSRFMTTF